MTPQETSGALVRFYDALARRDAETMAAMYAPDARFEDEVFRLRGEEIGRMWRSLLGRAREFSVTYTLAQAAADRGAVEWTARYLFAGKRPVVNVILSELRFENGRIVDQRDRFDFPRWAAQALGAPGRLFGRFGWFRRAVSRKARRGLGLPPSD
jgi:ketosteroid isomerase-like protein